MQWPAAFLIAVLALGTGQTSSPLVRSFDVAHSTMTVHVGKEGLFAFAADTHEVVVPITSGWFDPVRQQVELAIAAAGLQVQDPPSRRDRVQANMSGPDVLDVQQYPTIVFHSTHVQVIDAAHWSVAGELTLHGQTHPVTVNVNRQDDSHFTGSAQIVQSDFGITPIRIAGGAVRVKDEVEVTFSIVLQPR